MESKKKQRVKRKRPMAGWAIWFLKLTQHVIMTVAMLCVVAMILTSSVYIEDYGRRSWLEPSVENVEDRVQAHFVEDLYIRLRDVIRFATIRSQLETEGVFDPDKRINVSAYYNRKEGNGVVLNENYFPNAVYRLEDLIRWQQAGGLTYNIEQAENMFLTVNGSKLEDLVTSASSYRTLLKQMESCMQDLANNYSEYQYYMDEYEDGKNSFVYYIDMNNEAGDVYTNLEKLVDYSKIDLQKYFDNLLCATAGTNALYYDIKGNYEISSAYVSEVLSMYDYAFGSSAMVYAGFDMSLNTGDYYETIWEAYYGYNPNIAYILLTIICGCALYYVLVALYLMYAAGRKLDEEENEYIELKWSDAIYTELFLGWCAVLGFIITVLVVIMTEHYMTNDTKIISLIMAAGISLASFIGSVLVIESLCSLARRFKAGTLWKNSLLYLLVFRQLKIFGSWLSKKCHAFWDKMQYYAEHTGLWEKTWGVMLAEVIFYSGLLILMALFVGACEPTAAILIGTIIIGMIMIMSYRRMRRKMERARIVEIIEDIAAGEGGRVDEINLSIENAALGRAVNEIGEGIQKAVETSIKDERLKAELLTNVSHDIKTPLTSIINYVDLLKMEQIESEKAQEYIAVLESKSLKLKNLIQDLIEVSKISTGNIEYEMMPINFHELLMQALAEYDEKFNEHCLKLVYNNGIRDAVIMADSRRIWRVIENLLSNIYKYALEGTRVYVEVSQEDENVILMMKNISAKELHIQVNELTERFVRGDVSRTTEGSGLGLAIAQNLVIGQGGSFQIMLDGDLFKVKITFKLHDNKQNNL